MSHDPNTTTNFSGYHVEDMGFEYNKIIEDFVVGLMTLLYLTDMKYLPKNNTNSDLILKTNEHINEALKCINLFVDETQQDLRKVHKQDAADLYNSILLNYIDDYRGVIPNRKRK